MPGLKPSKLSAGLQGNNSYSYMPLNTSQASKATTLTGTSFAWPQTLQTLRRPPRQQLLQLHAPEHLCQLHAPAIYMLLPFARPQTLQTLRRPPRQQLLQLHAPEHLCQLHAPAIYMLLPALKPPNASNPPAGLQGNNSYSYMPLPSVFQGVQDCRLPALKPPNLPAGLQGNNSYSYMPLPSVFQEVQARPHQTPQTLPTLPQASKATTLTATCPCHLFFRGFKTAVCPPSNPLKPPKRFRRPPRQQLLQLHAPEHLAGLQGNNSYSYIVCQASDPPGLQGNNSYSYMPLNTSVSCMPQPSTCSCRLPGLKPSKLSAGLQGNSSYSYIVCPASTPPNSPQASKATTLTATCP